jgi:ferrous iron transport protein B
MLNICLVGNPNTGKTTLYNNITNSFEHIGNWHGVTVEEKNKKIFGDNNEVLYTDLPGIYSLTSFSEEEQVSIDYILNKKIFIYNICDANSLKRNLFLTVQLMELNKDFSIVINMKNDLKKTGKSIDIQKLGKLLGKKIYLVDGRNKNECKNLVYKNFSKNIIPNYCYDKGIKEIVKVITDKCNRINISPYFVALKIGENDNKIEDLIKLSIDELKKIENIKTQYNINIDKITKMRYEYIEYIYNSCVKENKNFIYGNSSLDKFILNKYLGVPLFILIMFTIFFITFGPIGDYFSFLISYLINDCFGNFILNLLIKVSAPTFILSFFKDALIGGIGSVLIFLPQVTLLFLGIGILEDSGYLSRVAFIFEDYLNKIGLSGRSIFTFIMGFGCSATAILTSRNMSDRNSRIKTILLTPFMSCSAKLPVYLLLSYSFFKNQILMIALLYFLGIFFMIIFAKIYDKLLAKQKEESFIMEFSAYRIPSFKRVFEVLYHNILNFLQRVGGIILLFAIIIWYLESFNFSLKFVLGSDEKSILQILSSYLAVIFIPLGFGNFGAVSSLLSGLVAKEVILSSLGTLNNITNSGDFKENLSLSLLSTSSVIHFTKGSCLSYLIFILFYPACYATMVVITKEIGIKWAIFSFIIQFILAYFMSLISYNLYNLFIVLPYLALTLFILLIVFLSLILFIKTDNNSVYCNGKCSSCGIKFN